MDLEVYKKAIIARLAALHRQNPENNKGFELFEIIAEDAYFIDVMYSVAIQFLVDSGYIKCLSTRNGDFFRWTKRGTKEFKYS